MASSWQSRLWATLGLGSGVVTIAVLVVRYRRKQDKRVASSDLVAHVVLGKPKWIRTRKAEGCRLWYKVRTSPGKHHFILVETDSSSENKTAQSRPLFDHVALAKAIQEKLDDDKLSIDADKLPLEDLKIGLAKGTPNIKDFEIADGDSDEDGKEDIDCGSLWATFKCGKRSWRWGPLTDSQARLDQLGGNREKKLQALSKKNLKSSNCGDKLVPITFENTTLATTLKVHWIDFDGAVKPYQQIKPGGKFAQRTYPGHLWLITQVFTREPKRDDTGAVDFSGRYVDNFGETRVLTQSGCHGECGAGWNYTVVGDTATIVGHGVTGKFREASASRTIDWSNGVIYERGSDESSASDVDSSDDSESSSNSSESESDGDIDSASSKTQAWISRRHKEGWLGTYEADAEETTITISQQSLSLADAPLPGSQNSVEDDIPQEGSRAESKLHPEHSLARIRPLYKGGKWICDDCRDEFSGPSWHCVACGFDLCMDCLTKTGKLRSDLPRFPVECLPKSRKVGVAWSPHGKCAAWVVEHNVHMLSFLDGDVSRTEASETSQLKSSTEENVSNSHDSDDQQSKMASEKQGETICLTNDGTKENTYNRHSFAWAKDGRALAMWKVQSPKTRRLQFIESSPPEKVHCRLRNKGKYMRPGDPMPTSRLVIFSSKQEQGKISWNRIEVAGNLFPDPFTESGNLSLRWHPDSNEVYVEYIARDRQLFRVVACDCSTGAERTILEERSEDPEKSFVDNTCGKRDWKFLKKGAEVLFLSERDGWCHLYLTETSIVGDSMPRQITCGQWVVRKVLYIDSEDEKRIDKLESRRGVWFLASGCIPDQDPYHEHLCWAPLDGDRELRILTADGDGTHEIMFSPCKRYFFDTWSRVDFPPVCQLRDARCGSLMAELERADASELLKSGYSPPLRFVTKGRDGATDIHGIIFKPLCVSFSSWWKKVPVVEDIYAGPHGAFCPKTWDQAFGKGHARKLVADGFCVVMLDGMGTNYRGRKFLEVSWRALHDQGFIDRKLWIREAASAFPWMDLTRVGIYGGSAGGQAAMRALLDHGDLYKVAVADCGCHDNRLDKIWWNEQWMGPDISHTCYKRSSNAEEAKKMSPEQKLLLIVGEIDSNVDPATTLRVVGELQRAGRHNFELCVVVGQGHSAAETAFGSQRRRDFLVHELLHKPTMI